MKKTTIHTALPASANRARDKGQPLRSAQRKRMETAQGLHLQPGALAKMRLDGQYTQAEVAESCGFDRAEHVRKYEGPNRRGESLEPFRAFERIARLMYLAGIYDIREVLEPAPAEP